MKTYFDSSAFAKRYIEETGSQKVETILNQTSSVGLSILVVPEIISAMSRRRREKYLNRQKFDLIKNVFIEDLEDVDLIDLSPEVVRISMNLIEKNTIKTLDALHISAALEWETDVFVSSDQIQLKIAKRNGLKIEKV